MHGTHDHAPSAADHGDGKKSKILLTCMLLTLFGAALCVLSSIQLFKQIQSSEPYIGAITMARKDARVLDRLGAPITDTLLAAESSKQEHVTRVELELQLTGPKNSAVLSVRAVKNGKQWSYEDVKLDLNGNPIDLLRK
jgi:hypothetical protein